MVEKANIGDKNRGCHKKTIKGGEETCVKSFLEFYLAPLIKKTIALVK